MLKAMNKITKIGCEAIKECNEYVILQRFTLPFQKLLIKEILKAHDKYNNNAVMPDWMLDNN